MCGEMSKEMAMQMYVEELTRVSGNVGWLFNTFRHPIPNEE